MPLGVLPSLASFWTMASTSSGSYLNHEGGLLVTGRVDPELPRFPEYSLAIESIWMAEPVARYLSDTGCLTVKREAHALFSGRLR